MLSCRVASTVHQDAASQSIADIDLQSWCRRSLTWLSNTSETPKSLTDPHDYKRGPRDSTDYSTWVEKPPYAPHVPGSSRECNFKPSRILIVPMLLGSSQVREAHGMAIQLWGAIVASPVAHPAGRFCGHQVTPLQAALLRRHWGVRCDNFDWNLNSGRLQVIKLMICSFPLDGSVGFKFGIRWVQLGYENH